MEGYTSKKLFLVYLTAILILTAILKAGEDIIRQNNKNKQSFYSSCYALVIGIDDYDNNIDWPTQTNASKNAVLVGNQLESMGFHVTYRANLNLGEFERALWNFFYRQEVDTESCLLFWFSGHGVTLKKEPGGYLVPTDAPKKNDPALKERLLSMRRLVDLSNFSRAKHIYMVFDSCLSSNLFAEKDSKRIFVSEATKYPDRQFLYACDTEGRSRVDNDSFRKRFIEILKGDEEKKSGNSVSYLTANEIGKIIKEDNLLNKAGYRAVYGRFRKTGENDKGDFVFVSERISSRILNDSIVEGIAPQLVFVPGGTFLMGDTQGQGYPNETPVHPVIVKSIAVSKYEITYAEYDCFCEATKRKLPTGMGEDKKLRGQLPVVNVSWEDAVAYCEWLSVQTGYTYRLPTEAEWEYFARAGTLTNYWWGNETKNIKKGMARWDCISEQDNEKTLEVDSFEKNPFGICGTVGNVWEWTYSEFADTFNGKENERLGKLTTGNEVVVIRGGAWDEPPGNCRVSHRKAGYPGERSEYIGFRVVKELEKSDKKKEN